MVVEVDAMPGDGLLGVVQGALGTTESPGWQRGADRSASCSPRSSGPSTRARRRRHRLDDLSILGPIFVLKLNLRPEGYDRKLVAEVWLYPDGSRILELSTKCAPADMLNVAVQSRLFLSGGARPERRAADEDPPTLD